jgi:class 3 adenylate cyclase/tetratricopeptide (TPR) repeat protein
MPVCRRCGQENPAIARLCMVCGTPFAAEAARSREERKVVTVLFADLVGFTSRSERMDVEDVRGTLVPYHALLRRQIERHGGTVEKFIGDAVMALFGAPAAHEDDPERAVRAALAIREALADLHEEDPALDLHVRVGVNTGEALVALDARPAEGEGMAAGDVVNTAARLQAAAGVDGILVGEATHRATAAAIEYRTASAVQAKGKSDPVPAWEAVGVRARLGVDVRQAPRTPLVGREPQLRLLEAALDQVRRDRAPQLVTLVGVPGIGKSRLVWELLQVVDSLPELVVWRQGRSLPYGEGVTFWAVGEMVKAQAGILDNDSDDEAAAKLEATVAEIVPDEDAAWLLRHLRPLVGLGGPETPGGGIGEAYAAWRRFFESLAERGPAVLVFEDLHWADDDLLEFVDDLVEWAADVPLLVLGTARPELLERRSDWGGGKPNSLVVSLAALSDADTARVIAGVLSQAVIPAETQSALLRLADGNPLYAEEYVRMLVDRGMLVRDGGGWRLVPGADLPLPDSIGAIIAARLDVLAANEKTLLQDASVLGKVFWPGALGNPAPDVLHALERKQFVRRERRSSVAGEQEYAFRHALIRDIAYNQIPRPRRSDLHRGAAAWIERLAAERPDDHAEMLVHHYTSALDYARAAGRDTSDLERLARTALRAAGDRARSLNALGAAARYYDAAAAMWPRDDPACGRVLLLGAELRTGPFGATTPYLTEALELLAAAGDVEGLARAHALIGWTRWNEADTAAADAEFETALHLLEGRPPSAIQCDVLEQQARRRMMAERNDEALGLASRAAAIAEELGLVEQGIECRITVGTTLAAAGDPAGIPALEAELDASRREGYAGGIVRTLKNVASHLFEAGEVEQASALWSQGEAEAARFGDRFNIGWFTVESAIGRWAQGRDTAVRAVVEQFLDELGGKSHYMECAAHELLASLHLEAGEIDAALAEAERAATFGRRAGEPQVLMPALTVHMLALAASGRTADAGAVAGELLEHMSSAHRGPWLVQAAAGMRALGRGPEMAEAVARRRDLGLWGRAALPLARGEQAAARSVLEAAGAHGIAAYCSEPGLAAGTG